MNWFDRLKFSASYYTIGHYPQEGREIYLWVVKDGKFLVKKMEGKQTHIQLFGSMYFSQAKGRVQTDPDTPAKASMVISVEGLLMQNKIRRIAETGLKKQFGSDIVIEDYTKASS